MLIVIVSVDVIEEAAHIAAVAVTMEIFNILYMKGNFYIVFPDRFNHTVKIHLFVHYSLLTLVPNLPK